jgi:hypothetical protein
MEVKKYFGHSYEAYGIENNNLLPAGGSKFSDELSLNTLIDTENLKDTLKIIRKNAEKNREQTKKWLADVNPDIDSELFTHLMAFTQVYDKKYGYKADHNKREAEYSKGNPGLSELIKLHAAECAEIAAFAQIYLQEVGIKSSFFSGEVLSSKKDEFAEKHSFIIIDYKGKEYIFDPANPIRADNNGKEYMLPRL